MKVFWSWQSDTQEQIGKYLVRDALKVAINKRAYPDHYLLLVNARHGEGVLDLDRVIEEMKKIRSPFLEVWVVVMVASGHMKVVRVAPGGFPIDLDLSAELPKAMKQEAFVKRGIRGTGTEIRDLGSAYVPIPRGD